MEFSFELAGPGVTRWLPNKGTRSLQERLSLYMHLSGGFRLPFQRHDTSLDAKNQLGGQRGEESVWKACRRLTYGPDANVCQALGRRTIAVVPLPGSLFSSMVPPARSTAALQMARPRP